MLESAGTLNVLAVSWQDIVFLPLALGFLLVTCYVSLKGWLQERKTATGTEPK